VQGDIIALLDNTGTVVVQYVYNAWGEGLVLDANGNEITSPTHIGQINPFRYRGYFYDVETGWYYLKSRYYDPTTGRFINMDSITYADSSAINGLNLYVYCENNPVMDIDPDGNWSLKKFWKKTVSEVKAVAKEVKDFFVEDVYGKVIKPAADWVEETIEDVCETTINFIDDKILALRVTEDGIVIGNSRFIITPGAQFLLSFYLNHINPNTRDIIKGTTAGVQGEWEAHNWGYYVLYLLNGTVNVFGNDIKGALNSAKYADIQGTVFNNPNHYFKYLMVGYNFLNNPLSTFIDYFIYKRNK